MKNQHHPTRRAAAVFAATCAILPAVRAQLPWPSRPLTIVVPYPPGGSNDLFARLVAKEMSEELKQPVVIDNRPGASGNLGTGHVAKATADGYTLVAVSSSMTTNAAIQPKLPYDPLRSFSPVAMFAKGPMIVAVNNDFSARTPQELVARIKAQPGRFNYASSGTGSVNQFATELLKARAGGMFITHIPYRGMAPAITDLVAGQTQLLLSSGPSLLPMVRSGKVRAIAVTSARPSAVAPELPTMSSAVPGYQFELWWGLLAPAGTPSPIVARLNSAVNKAIARPSVVAAFLNEGAVPYPLAPAQMATVIAQDVERWKELARQQNITVD